LTNVQALDVLPYHIMGVSKYKELDIPYPLEGIPAATQKQAKDAKQIILTAFWKVRRNKSE
jgi:pyruvate formate lyase activating enzyme